MRPRFRSLLPLVMLAMLLAPAEAGAAGPGGTITVTPATGLVDALPANPVISAEDAVNITGGAESRVYEAIARLVEAEVLRPLTDRKRNQVWGAGLILDELEDLDDRIATSMG